MRPRKRKHPKYKAYFDRQLRIMQEKFPFLSSQQIKAKILSTWESFSPEKKNDWGSPPIARLNSGNSSQGSDGTEVSPSYTSTPRHNPNYNSQETSPCPKGSTKKVRFSKPLSDILATPELPEPSMEHSESSFENSESSLPELDAWPISDEFNSISEHKLVVEQKAQNEKSESSQDEEMSSPSERDVWPALFGDTTSIWKTSKKKESNEEKEQPMCSLFEEAERKHFSERRILSGLSPSEVKASTDIFEGDNDDDIFA